MIRVRVPQDVLRSRLIKRALERDNWKLAHWDDYWATYGRLECTWSGVQFQDFDNEAPLSLD